MDKRRPPERKAAGQVKRQPTGDKMKKPVVSKPEIENDRKTSRFLLWLVKIYTNDEYKARHDDVYREEFKAFDEQTQKKHANDLHEINLKLKKESSGRSYKVGGGHVDGVKMSLATYIKGYLKYSWVKGAIIAFCLLFGVYVAYQFYLNFYSDIKLETVGLTTYSECIDTFGIAIRDEYVIEHKLNGASVNAVEDGAKVSKGQTIINIFKSSEAASAYTEIAEIDKEIEELKIMAIASEDSAAEVSNIERQINESLGLLLKDVEENDFSDTDKLKGNIAYLFNKRLVAMRQVEDYEDRISQLTSQKEALEAKCNESPSTVNAPESGYFATATDGYEDLLNTSMIDTLTVSEIEAIMQSDVADNPNAVGKLLKDFTWYLACPVDEKDAVDTLTVKSVYTLLLPYSETGSLKARLVSLNREENSSSILAIFECTSLASELCGLRNQPVKIQTKSYTGYSVKMSALHTQVESVSETDADNNLTGKTIEKRYPFVYVLVGNQLVRRRVDIIYNDSSVDSKNKIIICRPNTENSSYLQLYDKVVTEGKGLYAGKIIDS